MVIVLVVAVMVPSPKTQVGLSVDSGNIANLLLILFLTPLRTDSVYSLSHALPGTTLLHPSQPWLLPGGGPRLAG